MTLQGRRKERGREMRSPSFYPNLCVTTTALQQIAPSLRKIGNILKVLGNLILFQIALKTKEIRF